MNTIIHRPLDHWLFVRRKPAEVARFRAIYVGGPVQAHDVSILHGLPGPGRGRCCKRESWPDTFRRLYAGPKALRIDADTGQTEVLG
jgi:hypothetical protein